MFSNAHRLPSSPESQALIWGAGIPHVFQESLAEGKGGGSLAEIPARTSTK